MKGIDDEVRFASAVNALAAAFGKDAEPALVDAYFAALEDLDVGAVVAACGKAVQTCEFFPRPVHIRKLATPVEADPKLAASEAWEQMVSFYRGPHGHPGVRKKDHPTDEIANQAMALMGPMPKYEDWDNQWALKRFIDLYEMLTDRKRAEDRQRAITGVEQHLLGDGDGG